MEQVTTAVKAGTLETKRADCLRGLLHEFLFAYKLKADIEPESIVQRAFSAQAAIETAKKLSIEDCKRILTQNQIQLFAEPEDGR